MEISVIVASAVGIYFSLNYSTEEIFEFILTRTDDSSRCNLYDFAITLFKKHPIFGAGVGISDDTLFIPDDLKLKNFNFHSTIFHTMGTMGVFGIITYIIYYFCRYRILVVKNTAFSAYVYFSLTMFIAYGLIDTCEFNVIPVLSYITVTLLIAEKCRFLPQKDNLPLKTVK